MKVTLFYLFFILTWKQFSTKFITKNLSKKDVSAGQKSIFITKFDFGKNGGSIKIVAMHGQNEQTGYSSRELNFNIIKDQDLKNYQQQVCKNQNFQSVSLTISSYQRSGDRIFYVTKQNTENIHYLYLRNCENKLLNLFKLQSQEISVAVTLLNDESHFGEDDTIMPGYILLVLTWLALVVYFSRNIVDVLIYSRDLSKISVFSGLIMLGMAYFYRLVHLVLYYSNGQGIYMFQYLYYIIKSICQFIIVTLIVAIGWGWSITHLKHDQTYILAGVTVAIINIVGMIVSVSAEQMVESHHKYDSTAGYILQILRIIVLVIFLIGNLRTFNLSVSNIRKFIKKFTLVGTIYLSSWPFVVIFSQLFLPNYLHNEIITFVEEITHLIASAILCLIISNPESIYRKLSLKQQDNPLIMNNYKYK